MKLKYKGATGIFNGKLFIHGLNYDVEIIGRILLENGHG